MGVERETAFNDDEIFCAIPIGLYIPAGHMLHIEDSAAVDVADSMIVSYQYKLR